MVKVLVVGGAGYIGSHVVKALLQSGHRVTVYDNLSSGQKINLFSEAAFVEADILDFAALDKAMAGQEAVVHLAAKKAVGESMEKPELYAENNITGSLNIMKAMLKTVWKIWFFLRRRRFTECRNICRLTKNIRSGRLVFTVLPNMTLKSTWSGTAG